MTYLERMLNVVESSFSILKCKFALFLSVSIEDKSYEIIPTSAPNIKEYTKFHTCYNLQKQYTCNKLTEITSNFIEYYL